MTHYISDMSLERAAWPQKQQQKQVESIESTV